jgi:hypothetical protein
MQPIDINSLEHSHVYTIYEVYKSMFDKLEQQENKSEADKKKLGILGLQLKMIEKWAQTKMAEKLHWTKEEILLNYGNTPTLIVTFHPGSDGYNNYGKEVVANVDFTNEELLELFQNIQNKAERTAGIVNFKKVPEMTDGQFSTYDIFEIAGRKI